MNVKPLTQKNHRQGTMIAMIDLIQEMINTEDEDRMLELKHEIRKFDVTTIGDLYLTTGGRIVLDKGYGEYFTKGDKKIFTLQELTSGMKYGVFMNILFQAVEK
jgi:hypothetical protein